MIIINETDHRFRIAPSTIAEAGMGLYANELIKINDYLEIIGVCVDIADACNICTAFAERYKFANEPEGSFQHAIIPMGYAALVNHTDDLDKQNVAITYISEAKPKRNPACANVVYLAIKDIKPGDELLTNYHRRTSEKSDLILWKKLLADDFYGLSCLVADTEKAKLDIVC